MKNKLFFMITLVVCFSFVLNGCGNKVFNEKSISDIVKFNDVTKIEFLDGRGGLNKLFILEDKDKIKTFLGYMDSYIIKKEINHIDSAGWSHMANFYNGDKKVLSITFGDPLEINGVYYNVLKGNLNTKQIDEFIKSINTSWNIP